MGSNATTIIGIFLVLMFCLYNYLVFEFADKILENPKLKKIYRIPIGLLNTALAYMLTTFESSSSLLGYLSVLVAFLVEFHLFYRDTGKRIFFVVTAYLLHFMALRAMCIGIFSMATGVSVYEIANSSHWLIYSMAVTFTFTNIAILLVMKVIPAKFIIIINQHVEQLNFIVAWLVVFCVYFMVNSQVYSSPDVTLSLELNQIFAPIAVLAGLYVVLFFAIKNGGLLGYKEKNKELELQIHKEQQYRGAIIKDTIANYEFNLTQNRMLNTLGGDYSCFNQSLEICTYNEALRILAEKMIDAEDLDFYLAQASRDNLFRQFELGNRENVLEYRRIGPSGTSFWVRSTTNLMQDDMTGDVKGFTYVKNIDEEKKKQIELKHKAERDSLTSLYNKGMTGKKISEFLEKNPDSKNALFIIDIDDFKNVNDHFGHTFGDVVLCELSERLKTIFRSDDIVGRVGGDEFIAFVKNSGDRNVLSYKGAEICKAFQSSYKSVDNTIYKVSGSVGIAIGPTHGRTFQELYKNADISLYASKTKGKNCFTIYDGEDFIGYASNRTEIDNIGLIPQKSFKGNRIEYVFKILYGSANAIAAVNAVLEMISRHFKFSRGYIFSTDEAQQTMRNTFEWCAENIKSEIDTLQNISQLSMQNAIDSFYKTGMYIVESLNDVPEEEYKILQPQGIKSMMQFAFFNGNTLAGLIGFDDCVNERVPTHTEIDELATICNIIATFIAKQHATEDAEHTAKSMAAVLNNINSYTYVVRKDTYEIIFQNEKAAQSSPDAVVGKHCFSAYRGNNTPCADCPILHLADVVGSRTESIIYNKKWQMWIDAVVSRISWTDGEEVILVNCIDITKYRPQSEQVEPMSLSVAEQ